MDMPYIFLAEFIDIVPEQKKNCFNQCWKIQILQNEILDIVSVAQSACIVSPGRRVKRGEQKHSIPLRSKQGDRGNLARTLPNASQKRTKDLVFRTHAW